MKRNLLATVSLVTLVVASLGAAEDMKKHDAGELSFESPASWKTETPKSAMRKAQFKVGPVEGDKEAAELVVFVFPKGAGTVQANIDRWAAQFKDGEGSTPKPEVKTVKGKNVEVTRVEVAGRYVAPVFPGSSQTVDKPHFRLYGAIVQTDDAGYFFKMTGPEKTMKSGQAGFDALISSIEKAK
jgi:hypothetical protein